MSPRDASSAARGFRTPQAATTIGFTDASPDAALGCTRVSDPSPKSVWSQNLPLSTYFLNSITPEPVVKCMERVQ